MPTTAGDQLVKYLTDAHAIEEQALQQLRKAPDVAGEPNLARIFREHLTETEEHERLVRGRLEAHDAAPSRLKDTVMRAGGIGFLLFARLQPDTPGKLTAHAYSYEHLELASYELLERMAEHAGDQETAGVARTIRDQEESMAKRLAGEFDHAAEASLAKVKAVDLRKQLARYLADAHAIEAQAIQLLEKGPSIAGDSMLAGILEDHLVETRDQQELVEERMRSLDSTPSRLKDAALALGGLNWGLFFASHPDTPGKLAAFAFAFEHLEIASYELLKRVAQRAEDAATVDAAERILAQEREAAQRLAGAFDQAFEASLEKQGVGTK
jgi:ferritin-like metal-binding protein YciE